ncbi:MAG: N-acetylmuramoyl-L-alanine amidase [Bythopirellula sp.]
MASATPGLRVCPGPPEFSSPPSAIAKPELTSVRSPNFDDRGNPPSTVDSIVMHTTQTSLENTLRLFGGAASTSAHFVIAENGDIYQMVDTEDRAYHATYYNSRSIGIEMVGTYMNPSMWNDENLGALVELMSWIVSAYPDIPVTHPSGDAYDFGNDRFDVAGIVAHGQVQPWNRGDPGRFFPWDDVLGDVAARLAAVPEPSSVLLLSLGCIGFLVRRKPVA